MSILNFLAEIDPLINGILGPAIALFIAPRYLREPVTGVYTGFRDPSLFYLLMGWSLIKALTIYQAFGLTWEASVRLLVTASSPFAGAWVWVKLTDHFGWEKSHQIR
ncbi:MAG: hypothetical protein Q7L07_16690 [Pseudohongiella sp.]|nr:hypothetical protein [Pseudohongiella sp.]MDP2282641.1 hypothetical protein [Pseudohongiella sp.]